MWGNGVAEFGVDNTTVCEGLLLPPGPPGEYKWWEDLEAGTGGYIYALTGERPFDCKLLHGGNIALCHWNGTPFFGIKTWTSIGVRERQFPQYDE
jgi:hypothetical protein